MGERAESGDNVEGVTSGRSIAATSGVLVGIAVGRNIQACSASQSVGEPACERIGRGLRDEANVP